MVAIIIMFPITHEGLDEIITSVFRQRETTMDSRTMWVSGVPTFRTIENPCTTYSQPSINLCVWVCAQSCPTFFDSMDCSPPDSSVLGVFQAKILERFAISFSRGYSQPRDWTRVSWVSWMGRWILYPVPLIHGFNQPWICKYSATVSTTEKYCI